MRVLTIICLMLLIIGVLRTLQLSFTKEQGLFDSHTAPTKPMNGLYTGTVPGHSVSWKGKMFNVQDNTGINIFSSKGGEDVLKYPFTTSVGKGAHDYITSVIKIDYNVSGNPLWIRPVLDEVVEISPGVYLGKLEVRIVPYFPFTLAYFELRK